MKLANRAVQTTRTQGLGAYTLDTHLGVRTQRLADALGLAAPNDAADTIYTVESDDGFEIAYGTVTREAGGAGHPDTLTRGAMIETSNADAAVDWGAGIRNVFIDIDAANLMKLFTAMAGAPVAGDVGKVLMATAVNVAGWVAPSWVLRAGDTMTGDLTIQKANAALILKAAAAGQITHLYFSKSSGAICGEITSGDDDRLLFHAWNAGVYGGVAIIIWPDKTVDIPRLRLPAQDAVNEGGEFNMVGAAAYPSATQDLYQNTWRIFNSAVPANALTFDLVTGRLTVMGQVWSGGAQLGAPPKYVTTAVDLALDATYRDGHVDVTAAKTITLPNLVAGDAGFRVTIANMSATEADDTTIVGFGGSPPTIDGVANRKIWPGTKLRLLWKGAAWFSANEGWIPASRVVGLLGTEATLDISLMMVPAAAREVKILWRDIQAVGGTADLQARISLDGMATFDAGATNYEQVTGIINTAGGAAGVISTGQAFWVLGFNASSNVALTAAPKHDGQLRVNAPRVGIAGRRPVFWGDFNYPTGAAAWEANYYLNKMHKTAHSFDGFRLLWGTAGRTFIAGSILESYWR